MQGVKFPSSRKRSGHVSGLYASTAHRLRKLGEAQGWSIRRVSSSSPNSLRRRRRDMRFRESSLISCLRESRHQESRELYHASDALIMSSQMLAHSLTGEVPELISADSFELQRNFWVPPRDETRQVCSVQVGPSARAMEPSNSDVSEACAFIFGLKSTIESLRDWLEGSISSHSETN